jgi:arsenite methyltransferase
MTDNRDEIRSAVRSAYGARAAEVATREDASPSTQQTRIHYEGLAEFPATVVSYGCGNPVAIAGLEAGETVLDLGSGAGLDCFLSAQRVGPTGRVIGLDMTDEMIALAEGNRAKLGVENVEFRKGIIEEMPIDDSSVDVIISNCVINLSPDKDAVFREAFRVLRPGGRFQVSDVVLRRDITAEERADLDLWSGCKSGALLIADYEARLRAAGFEDVAVLAGDSTNLDEGPAWVSALINARRPGGTTVTKPWRFKDAEVISLLSPVGLDIGAACGVEGECC